MLTRFRTSTAFNGIDINQMIAAALSAGESGELNSFIPALSRVPRDKFGLVVCDASGGVFAHGDACDRFSIQSISKLFALIALMQHSGVDIWQRIGSFGSATERFDSMAMLEFKRGIPTHPFLNAGALVVTDMLLDITSDPLSLVQALVAKLVDRDDVGISQEVAASEIETADRNRALAYYLRSFGNIKNNVDTVVDAYCRMCAMELSCYDLADIAARLIGKPDACAAGLALSNDDFTMLVSVLRNCGLYEESLELGTELNIRAKSGSGGGILAAIGDRYSVAVWAPPLGPRGNSAAGISLLKQLGRAFAVGTEMRTA